MMYDKIVFKKVFDHLDLTETKDAWGRSIFLHPHVQSLWDGWRKGRVNLREELIENMRETNLAQHRSENEIIQQSA